MRLAGSAQSGSRLVADVHSSNLVNVRNFKMLMRPPLNDQELDLVRQFAAAYKEATAKVAAALAHCTAGQSVSQEAIADNQRAGDALRRIREIYGDAAPTISTGRGGFGIK
jgi:hypothetical protein